MRLFTGLWSGLRSSGNWSVIHEFHECSTFIVLFYKLVSSHDRLSGLETSLESNTAKMLYHKIRELLTTSKDLPNINHNKICLLYINPW